MDLRPLLRRAVNDYKSNLKFVVPRLLEYLLDIGIFFTSIIVIAIILGLTLSGFSYERLLRPFPEIPFSVVAVVLTGASVGILGFMAVTAASRGAIIAMALSTYRSRKTTLLDGWDGAKNYMPRIFLYFVFLLGALITGGILFFLTISLLVGTGSPIAPFMAFFLAAAALIGMLAFYVFTLFTPQVIAVMDTGVVDGLKGGVGFVRSNFGAVAAYGGIVFALTVAVGLFMTLIFFIINEVTRYNPFLNLAAKIFRNILAFAIGIVVSPYFEIVKTYMVIEDLGNKEEEDEGTAGKKSRDNGTCAFE